MELTNTFVVDAAVETTWAMLTDLARVAPCLPGASLTRVDGEDYHGTVTIKVGPVTAAYAGTARFTERDDTAHRGVIRAQARETRGQGGASATVSAQLTPHGTGTEVTLLTDLALSGRLAQFGRGVIADVSAKLIGQFAERLEQEITSGTNGSAPHTAQPAEPSEPAGLDVATFAAPVLRRALPALGAAGAALLAGFALGRLGRPGRRSPAVVLQIVPPAHQEVDA